MASSREYNREYQRALYRRRRRELIDRLGGRCMGCGSVDDLQIDHRDPATKLFDLGKGWSYAFARVEAEIEKCQLLCATCHARKSSAESSVEHGGGLSGRRNCKCAPCRARKAQYMAAFRDRKAVAA